MPRGENDFLLNIIFCFSILIPSGWNTRGFEKKGFICCNFVCSYPN